jgi:hypothetical protein
MNLSLPQLEIYLSIKQINLFLAGVGSGKTHLDGLISYRNVEQFPKVKGFIGANTYDQLNCSTIFRIREVWKSFGIVEYDDKTKLGYYVIGKQPPKEFKNIDRSFISYNNIITFKNGATIFLGSLDNAKAHEGKEFGWAILDETKDTKEEDVKDIILARLRQLGIYVKDGKLTNDSTGISVCPLYITTSPAKTDWINDWFGLDKYISDIQNSIYSDIDYFKLSSGNKFCTISSTYHNQENLPSNYIENKKEDWTSEKFKTLIYANPFSRTGAEYYSSFDRIKHVGEVKYREDLSLHISFDFNVVPYNSLSIWQIEKKDGMYYVYGIDEICLENPNNSTAQVCDTFLQKYRTHKSGIFFYADATGRARTVVNKENSSNISVIESKLSKILHNYSNRVPFVNMPNTTRRDFINRILEERLPIRMIIGSNMKNMISDFTYTKQDSITGGKDKHRVKDPDTGETYEKYGHMGDNCEYFVCQCFKDFINKDK